MEINYWSRILSGRVSRRRAIAATGGSAAAALLLAACGSSSGGSSSGSGGTKEDKSSIVVKPVDSTKEAKRGGTIKDKTNADITSMDVQQPMAPLNLPARHVYSTLVRQKAGYIQGTSSELSPDFAQSWETSPDGLQITMKLRQTPSGTTRRRSTAAPPIRRRRRQLEPLRRQGRPSRPSCQQRQPDSAGPRHHGSGREDGRRSSSRSRWLLPTSWPFRQLHRQRDHVPKETEAASTSVRHDRHRAVHSWTTTQPSVGFTLKRNPDYWDKDASWSTR